MRELSPLTARLSRTHACQLQAVASTVMSGFASPELMYAAAELFKEERESTSTIDAFGLAAASLPTVSLTSFFPPSSLLSLLGTHNGGGGGGDDGLFTLIEGTNWDVEDEDFWRT